MIFLIEYNRSEGRIINIKEFKNSERAEAENLRLQIELGLNRNKLNYEVVLLEAASKDALLKTHSRYFKTYTEIGSSSIFK
jgi:F420-0:gamma-glutamyl ligase